MCAYLFLFCVSIHVTLRAQHMAGMWGVIYSWHNATAVLSTWSMGHIHIENSAKL
jgi:hypothetical protein